MKQVAHGLCSGVVDICDCARIDDEPANRCRCALHEGANFVDKAILVRIKKVRPEAINDQSRSVSAPGNAGAGSHWPVASGTSIIVCGR
jgi:hypothetical protein